MVRRSRSQDELLRLGVEVTELSPQEGRAVDQRWLGAFAAQVKKKHGVSVYLGYRWHGFSYRLQPFVEGQQALETYLRQRAAPYYVFDEDLEFCALCNSEAYPDLSGLGDDVSVSHRNMRWTMAFTHEQPDIGPFFATG